MLCEIFRSYVYFLQCEINIYVDYNVCRQTFRAFPVVQVFDTQHNPFWYKKTLSLAEPTPKTRKCT